MYNLFVIILLLVGGVAKADFKLLEVEEMYVDFYHFKQANDSWVLPTGHPKEQLDLHINLDIFNRFAFMKHNLHSQTDSSQYRLIAWQYRVGVRPCDFFEVWIEHMSQHLLDTPPASSRSYDAFGFSLYLYRRDK